MGIIPTRSGVIPIRWESSLASPHGPPANHHRQHGTHPVARHHGRERLSYAVTVRFAPTSTPEQLAMAGALCRADASLYLKRVGVAAQNSADEFASKCSMK